MYNSQYYFRKYQRAKKIAKLKRLAETIITFAVWTVGVLAGFAGMVAVMFGWMLVFPD